MRGHTWVSSKSCWSRLLRRFGLWARPRFSNHWGNWLFLPGLAFSITFFPVASAKADYWLTDDPPYRAGSTSIAAARAHCSALGFSVYRDAIQSTFTADLHSAICAGGSWASFFIRRHSSPNECPDGEALDPASGQCIPPPPEPQNCTDLASQSDPFNVTVTNYQTPLQICNQGCNATAAGGVGVFDATGTGVARYTYDGTPCPGGDGYNSELGIEDNILETEPPKNCYGADGSYLGQVSANANCPNLVNCYSVDDGQFMGTAGDPSSCEAGTVTKTELPPAIKNQIDTTQQTTESTSNPDGSVTETTTTETTEKGADGSTYSRQTTTTCTTAADGTRSCNTTVSDVADACTGADCPVDPMSEQGVEAAVKQAKAQGVLPSGETDEWGQLTGIHAGTVDVSEQFGLSDIFADNGAAGSCPSPESIGLGIIGQAIEFKWDTVCEFLSFIRPIVIFAAMWIAAAMISGTVLGTSYKSVHK